MKDWIGERCTVISARTIAGFYPASLDFVASGKIWTAYYTHVCTEKL